MAPPLRQRQINKRAQLLIGVMYGVGSARGSVSARVRPEYLTNFGGPQDQNLVS